MFIYKITCKDTLKVYVGKTKEKRVERRWNDHKRKLRGGQHHNTHLQAAWNKYGEENFVFEVIEQFNPEMNFDLNNLERFWIKELDSMNREKGFNRTSGGDGFPERGIPWNKGKRGYRLPSEWRTNISKAHKKSENVQYNIRRVSENNKKTVLAINKQTGEELHCTSILEASNITGADKYSISKICNHNHNRKSANGWLFKFYNNLSMEG